MTLPYLRYESACLIFHYPTPIIKRSHNSKLGDRFLLGIGCYQFLYHWVLSVGATSPTGEAIPRALCSNSNKANSY
ncbi:hypothetical protein [Nostoc parmelioides]|uniref:Uncharacterized protein n=1 Tax=Nostoc parmelioides FACHB-3921 TaxID=2692909 RepID=A0ABR8BJJ1_9NOSO|nr:hypothetical protein [Nostoc parmelioides]MBD2253060.1 hypothetical protein [Nostoc parmelioides FACHB-3921]